jgi:hypothetical protein
MAGKKNSKHPGNSRSEELLPAYANTHTYIERAGLANATKNCSIGIFKALKISLKY